MSTATFSKESFSPDSILQLLLCGVGLVLLAVSFSSSSSLLAAPSDFLRVLSPFAIQDTFGIADWASWVPVVLSVLFFAAVIANSLTGSFSGVGTKVLFYVSAIAVAFSVYFKIAVMALDYVSVTTLAAATDLADFIQYGFLAMPVLIVVATILFVKFSPYGLIEDQPALGWLLYVTGMVLLGALAPALVYLLVLVSLWLMMGAVLVIGVAVLVPILIWGVWFGAVAN